MSSINKTENYNLSQFGNDDVPDWRTDYSGDMQVIDEELTRLNNEVTETKKSVSDGKSKVASAITDKGIVTLATDTFDVIAENVGKIQSGGNEIEVMTDTTKGAYNDICSSINVDIVIT